MRFFILLFVTLGLITGARVDSLAQSQTEMNATAGADLDNADKKLNAVYKKLLSQNAEDKELCNNLREAQRAWIKFVEFHMKTVFPLREGENPREVYGSIYPLEFATEKTELTQQRITQLENLLKQ